MRRFLIAAIAVCALAPRTTDAQNSGPSTATVTRSTLLQGQAETVKVVAHDLAGRPLPDATVSMTLTSGSHKVSYKLPSTDVSGRTTYSFLPPKTMTPGRVAVLVNIESGFLNQTVLTRFALKVGSATSSGKLPSPTPTPSPRVPTSSSGFAVSARALPPQATAPNPVYVVVYASDHSVSQPGVQVTVTASFEEGVERVTGTTDQYGVATLRIDTASARISESVKVMASAKLKGATSKSATQFDVAAPVPTATPTASSTPTPTDIPTATPTSTPVRLAAPVQTSTSTPIPTDTPVPTPTPFVLPTPVYTPTPVDTATPIPTSTPAPTPTLTPLPTATATPLPNCPGSQAGCMQAMLNLINATRSANGVAPLTLSQTQSAGAGACVGSYGHSTAMASSGSIWHQNASYPTASFPNNICVASPPFGENVGQFSSGNELTDLQGIHNLMMGEAHDKATCSAFINHACNILNANYGAVGIGIYYDGRTTWLTEDFLG